MGRFLVVLVMCLASSAAFAKMDITGKAFLDDIDLALSVQEGKTKSVDPGKQVEVSNQMGFLVGVLEFMRFQGIACYEINPSNSNEFLEKFSATAHGFAKEVPQSLTENRFKLASLSVLDTWSCPGGEDKFMAYMADKFKPKS